MLNPPDVRARPAPPDKMAAYSALIRRTFSSHSQIHDGVITDALALRGHTDSVRALAITPDGRTLVSGSDDRTIRRWDLTTGAEIGTPLTGHTDWVRALAITPDGTRCIVNCAPSEATGLSVPLRTTGPANAPLSFALTVYTFGT